MTWPKKDGKANLTSVGSPSALVVFVLSSVSPANSANVPQVRRSPVSGRPRMSYRQNNKAGFVDVRRAD